MSVEELIAAVFRKGVILEIARTAEGVAITVMREGARRCIACSFDCSDETARMLGDALTQALRS